MYNAENVKSLSNEEILAEIKRLELVASSMNTRQLGKKISLNSLYGSSSNRYFTEYFDQGISLAITASGQNFIQWIAKRVNDYFKDILKTDFNFIIYSDTDSCRYNTELKIKDEDGNYKTITISELYEKYAGQIMKSSKDNYTCRISSPIQSLTVDDDNKLGYKNITYIKKHLVKKQMFKIKSGDKEIVITKDHSLIVMRDGSKVDVSPMDIKKGDKIIAIKENING